MNAKGKQVTTERKLGIRLKRLLKKKSLGDVLREDFPFSSFGTLSRIAAGNFPKRPDIRERFGLPSMVSVVGCPNCDGVHTRACRPKRVKVNQMCKVGWVLIVADMLKRMEKVNE